MATDSAGHIDLLTVEVQVGDIDVLERDVRVTFDARGWSIRQDAPSANSDGFEAFGVTTTGATEYCYTIPAVDANHTENFSTRPSFWPSVPMSVEGEVSGTFCGSFAVRYDEGSWNATLPYDIHLDLPDEVVPGASFTLNSTATRVDEGAAFWGQGPGFAAEVSLELSDVDLYMAGCDDLFSHACSVLIERRSIYRTMRDALRQDAVAWTGGLLDDPARTVLTVPEAVRNENVEVSMNWDDTWMTLLTALGFPSNTGSMSWELGAANGSSMYATLDYTIFTSEVFVSAASEEVMDLEVHGVDAILAFENGATRTFRVGTPATIQVPANGDQDGDGDVDVSIEFVLDASYHNTSSHTERSGYRVTTGFGRASVTAIDGTDLLLRRFGPMLDHQCATRIGGAQIPITCFTSGGTDLIDYAPSAFSVPLIVGAADLAGP
jgi:hypothetical protein